MRKKECQSQRGEATLIPLPCPPVLLRRRRYRFLSKVKPGKKGGVGESVRFGFYITLSHPDLTGNKSIIFPQVECVFT